MAASFWSKPIEMSACRTSRRLTERQKIPDLQNAHVRLKTIILASHNYINTHYDRLMMYQVIFWYNPSLSQDMGVSKNKGTPGWFIMENPIKMDDLGYPYFWKHPYRFFGSLRCASNGPRDTLNCPALGRERSSPLPALPCRPKRQGSRATVPGREDNSGIQP